MCQLSLSYLIFFSSVSIKETNTQYLCPTDAVLNYAEGTMFQAQLNTMVTWLDQWNKSGQTVALFKLLTKLAPIQARFASIAIDYSLADSTELALQEQEANNPGNYFVTYFLKKIFNFYSVFTIFVIILCHGFSVASLKLVYKFENVIS